MTGDQLQIVTVPETPPRLTGPRQQLVYDLLQAAGREGLTADEAGAHVHAATGKHLPGERCAWCGRDGGQVLRALRKKKVVKSRRDGNWTLATAEPAPATFGDFPEGF